MSSRYTNLFQAVQLSSVDQETVKSFQDNPESRAFLAVSEILSKYGHHEDALQLCMEGVSLHPTYTAARVVLAQSLFSRSIFYESWQLLKQSPSPLSGNKTAQILMFKLALILGYEQELLNLRQNMIARGQLDSALHHLSEDLDVKGFNEVRNSYIEVLRAEGYDLESIDLDVTSATTNEKEGPKKDDQSLHEDPVLLERLIDGYYVSPIEQIFSKKNEELLDPDSHDLDAVTLAQIYRKQKRFQKALEIYQRLLYMAPNNDLFKKQVEELQSLVEDQSKLEQKLDPDLVERMDRLETVNHKIAILSKLLHRLDSYESKQDI